MGTFFADPDTNAFVWNHRTSIAAGSASIVTTLVGFPLDSIKSRLQVKTYEGGVLGCVKSTFREEGFRGFFRGLLSPLITISVVRTTSFTIYTETKKTLHEKDLFNKDTVSGRAISGFLGGATSGALISAGSCPFELTKIRAQLSYHIAASRGIPYRPEGTLASARDIIARGGYRGLYAGMVLHSFRDCFGTGIYFAFYDSIRHSKTVKRTINEPLQPFLCGSLCGVMSWIIVYPLDLVKTRYQRARLEGDYDKKAWGIWKEISSGGIRRMYTGLGISVARSMFTHGLMWWCLERFVVMIGTATGGAAQR
ncbi:mitochondrial carrier [Atractiella rhizophila]|nr:mitochondrial carrier [Atractiella rhizophila]